MGAGAANFRRLVRAFHVKFLTDSVLILKTLEPLDAAYIAPIKISAAFYYRKLSQSQQHLTSELDGIALSRQNSNKNVDKLLII
jgi:hypothetical protein